MKIIASSEHVHPGIASLGYTVTKRLGKGAFGEVWVVGGKDGGRYAMKEIKRGRYQEAEVEALVKVRGNANIVEFLGAFKKEGSVFLLMEYITGGTLADRIQWQKRKRRRFRESKITSWVTGMSHGLAFIHCAGIVHRDLKSANVFLTENDEVKIGDFGMAHCKTTRSRGSSICGTPIYMSPEMWSAKRYTEQTDLWSLGVILYEITSLRKPFKAATQQELCTKVTTQLPPPLPTTYSAQLRSLISVLLSPCPESRPSAATLPMYLNNSFSSRSTSSGSSSEGGWI